MTRLGIRLVGDGVDQLVGELGDVHQLRPRPRERLTELGDEVAHAGLAAGDPVGLEQAHLRPAQTEAVADRVVDLFGGGDAVVDHPERFTPDRFEEAIGDEGVDLHTDVQRLHARGRVDRHRPVDRSERRAFATHHLDQRQQVHGVERVPDDEPFGVGHLGLEVGGLEARGRRCDQGAGRRGSLDVGEDRPLQRQPLRHRLLDEVGIGDRLVDRSSDRQIALPVGRQAQLFPGVDCVGVDLAGDALGVGGGVGDGDVDPVQDEARRPARPDDTAADGGDLLGEGHVRTAW